MIFSKLTSVTLFLLLTLTATGRPNLKLSEVIRSRESSWDPSDDCDHWPAHEDDYWDHDHDYDYDEYDWDEGDEGDDDHYWGYYDYDHDNDWDDDSDWDHDWDSSWVSDWDERDDDGDQSWKPTFYQDWDSSWDSSGDNYWNGGSNWNSNSNSNQKIGWDYDDYNPNDKYGAVQVYAGAGTVYIQDGVAGSCGTVYDDNAFICALGNTWMNGEYISSECGRQIRVTNLGSFYPVGGEGNSIIVTVMDTCATCDENHIDLSIAAWNALTDDTEFGMLNIQWSFVDE